MDFDLMPDFRDITTGKAVSVLDLELTSVEDTYHSATGALTGYFSAQRSSNKKSNSRNRPLSFHQYSRMSSAALLRVASRSANAPFLRVATSSTTPATRFVSTPVRSASPSSITKSAHFSTTATRASGPHEEETFEEFTARYETEQVFPFRAYAWDQMVMISLPTLSGPKNST